MLVGCLICCCASYPVSSSHVCSSRGVLSRVIEKKNKKTLNSSVHQKQSQHHLIWRDVFQQTGNHVCVSMKCSKEPKTKTEWRGSLTATFSVSLVKPLAGLVSMEIQCWRLNEEKTFLLGENRRLLWLLSMWNINKAGDCTATAQPWPLHRDGIKKRLCSKEKEDEKTERREATDGRIFSGALKPDVLLEKSQIWK